jgi:hypothetical protein
MLFGPFLPAFILFKTLPNKAFVKGPFHGLRIDLGGAFAGYFVLVVFVCTYLFSVRPPAPDPGEMWLVKGHLRLAPSDSSRVEQTVIQTFPPANIANDGEFTIYILRKTDPNVGGKRFPDLLFALSGHQYVTIHIEDELAKRSPGYGALSHYDVNQDKFRPQQLNIDTPIALGIDQKNYADSGVK